LHSNIGIAYCNLLILQNALKIAVHFSPPTLGRGLRSSNFISYYMSCTEVNYGGKLSDQQIQITEEGLQVAAGFAI
jgi:hypothetical protein